MQFDVKAIEMKNDLQNENFAGIHKQPCNFNKTPGPEYTTARVDFMIKKHL